MTESADTVAVDYRNLRVEDEDLSTQSEPLLDYIQLFGMTQPPFEKGLGGFFADHGRQSLLAQLIHLLHFSDNVSTLIGPAGVGKSALLQEIDTKLGAEDYVFYRAGIELGTANQLLFSLAKTIGLAVSEQDSIQRLRARLNEWSEFSGGSLQVYILIDDADLLEQQTLDTLLDLASPDESGSCWHLLLVGSPDLADKLLSMPRAEAEPPQIFSMPEVNQEFVADYLAFRLSDAGFDDPSPFSETDEESIWLTSGGDLNRVNAMAEIHLLKKAAAPVRTAVSIPWLHISALAALGLLLTLAWWGYEGEATSVIVSAPMNQIAPLTVDQTNTSVSSKDNVAPALGDTLSQDEQGITVKTEAPAEDPLMASGGLVKAEPTELTPAPMTTSITAAPIAATPITTPIPATPPLTPAKPPSSSRDFAGDEQLLLALAPEHFTLQVLAAESKAGVERFIEANASEPLRWYATKRSGKAWYVVVLGDYDSADQARRATQRLPKNLQKAGPWPRTLASVQQQINEN